MIKRTIYIGNPAYLSLYDRQMVMRKADEGGSEKTYSFPIEDLGFVVLDHQQITITHGLIDALLDAKCSVVACSRSHIPTGLMLPLSATTLQSERFRAQISSSLPLKKQMWKQTIEKKIENQCEVLRRWRQAETGCMEAWARQVKSGDSDNLEGRAAVYYWRNLFDPLFEFKRDRDGAFPNNFLNYGYAMLRAIVARALVCAGLLPTLGIHHHNRYNAYCLADDIMEPYRPIVDDLVLGIIKRYPGIEDLTKEIKASFLSLPVIDVKISGGKRPLMLAASETAMSVFRCFSGEGRKIVYPDA